jgi:hypothetical protein
MSVPILAMMPFALDRNLGAAYNAAMKLLPDDGWAIFIDHDCMHTHARMVPAVQEAIAVPTPTPAPSWP